MNCLVTGASGFIGSALVKRLVKDGYHVRAVLHTTPPVHRDSQVDYVTADLTDPSSLPSVVHDIDIVFHCGALVEDFGSKKEILNVNLKGTQYLVDACPNTVRMFIFLSHLHNKSTINAGAYSYSKALAEHYLLEQYHTLKFPVTILRPGNVYGPGATTWVLRLLQAIQENQVALINNGTGLFLHAYIDNLIDALVATIDAPDITGEIIDITDGDNQTTWRTYFNDLAAIAGKPPIKRTMTKTTALLISKIMMIRYYMFRRDPLITPTAVHILTNQRTISIENATKLLGYHPAIDYIEGMNRTGKWLKEDLYI